MPQGRLMGHLGRLVGRLDSHLGARAAVVSGCQGRLGRRATTGFFCPC